MYSLGFSPLWGENGFVQKIVELNNVAVKENGDLVFIINFIIFIYNQSCI